MIRMFLRRTYLGRDHNAVSTLHVLEHEHPEVEVVDEGVEVLGPGAGGGEGAVGGVPAPVAVHQLHLALGAAQRLSVVNPEDGD